jgi:formylmethanofuran dehydrogenase subunit D
MGEMSRLQVTLITGRTIDQGVGKERGKSSEEYGDSVSICQVDPEDLKKLGIKAESNVLVSTEYGSVVVRAVKSPSAPHVGVVFMPYGLWANVIMNTETHSIGMPSLKGIPAEILPAQDRLVLSLPELLKEQFRK